MKTILFQNGPIHGIENKLDCKDRIGVRYINDERTPCIAIYKDTGKRNSGASVFALVFDGEYTTALPKHLG